MHDTALSFARTHIGQHGRSPELLALAQADRERFDARWRVAL